MLNKFTATIFLLILILSGSSPHLKAEEFPTKSSLYRSAPKKHGFWTNSNRNANAYYHSLSDITILDHSPVSDNQPAAAKRNSASRIPIPVKNERKNKNECRIVPGISSLRFHDGKIFKSDEKTTVFDKVAV